jgi:hypothetical protein
VNDLTDQQLLRDYAERRSEPAFAELVRRHVDFVHSAGSQEDIGKHFQQVTETNQRILDQAAGFLTPQQLTALATVQNNSLTAQKLQGAALTQKH